MDNRTIVIGDVHGCLDELIDLINLVGYRRGKDELVFVGDLVDRGPDSVGVVKYVQRIGAKCILGNHEEKFIRYKNHELRKLKDPKYKNPMRFGEDKQRTYIGLNDEDFAFLSSLPLWRQLNCGWVAVHAGFIPGISLVDQPANACLRARYLDKYSLQTKSLGKDFKQPENSIAWWNAWTGPEYVIYGHNVHSLERPLLGDHSLGIDTGVCFGGRLTAAVFYNKEKFEIAQVKAKYVYFGKDIDRSE